MPLNFHGHILVGHARNLMIPLDGSLQSAANSGSQWTDTILSRMTLDPALARWCYYRLTLYSTDNIGSAESVVLRTAVWRFTEALYSSWEVVTTYFSGKSVEDAIDEFHLMAQISKEYPVMLWEYFDEDSQVHWIDHTMEKLPSLESIKVFYELPHMRAMFINVKQGDFCDDNDREAEKAYRRALGERNKRLNRSAKDQSRRNQK
jgi:hypothetical protein